MAFQMESKEKLGFNFSSINQVKRTQPIYPFSQHIKHRKKRIGPYSYYEQDLIGYGSSSSVYRCVYQNDKSRIFAIKVIELRKMTSSLHKLLQNEISILKKLQHPHILKLHDVYFTENNCYLITDFCEGGTLESYLDQWKGALQHREEKFRQIWLQLFQGCKYLAQQLVIHRDLKPANIFLKEGVWKIGDFGFARTLSEPTQVINEKYNVGSPLFMPLEALEKSIYSLKTDSFALGVILFHIMSKQFPWNGKNKRELLFSYTHKPFPAEKLTHINKDLQQYIKGLCEIQSNCRLYIHEFDKTGSQTEVSKNLMQSELTEESYGLESDNQIEDVVRELDLKLGEQLKLCLFVVYMERNIESLAELAQLGVTLRRHLAFLVKVFGWKHKKAMEHYIEQFQCEQIESLDYKPEYCTLSYALKKHIAHLAHLSTGKQKVLALKLRQYEKMVQALLTKDCMSFKKQLAHLTLHPNFSQVCIREDESKKIEKSDHVNYSF